MSKKCVKCNATLEDDDHFCKECGAAQPVEKRCPKCNSLVKDNAAFCANCGAKLDEKIQAASAEPTIVTNKQNMKKFIIGILVAAIVVGAGAGIYYYEHVQNSVAQTETTSNTESSASEQNAAAQEPVKDDLAQANEILKSKGYSYTVGAVSPVNDAGFLGLITDKGRAFIVYDKKDDVVALLSYQRELLNLRSNKSGNMYKPVVLMLHIKNDRANNDRKLGYWHDGIHTFPVYSLYDVDADGNIVPGKLYSGEGRKPSHYHDYLHEQQNVNIVNLALTSADSLKQDMDSRNITL